LKKEFPVISCCGNGIYTYWCNDVRIAIFHDYFSAIGGGERVVVAMAKILNADIITTDTDAVEKLDSSVHVISLGNTITYPGLKQISAALKFYFCNFSRDYDVFIFSGNWAHYAAHQHHPNIWYCHTPVRVFYDNYENFLSTLPFFKRFFFRFYAYHFRFFEIKSLPNIDHIMTNSYNIQKRIERYFQRKSDVIYPPIETSKFYCSEYGAFWLSVNRLYPEKQIELQIESFRAMPELELIIVGGYAGGDHSAPYVKKIQSNTPSNVTFSGELQETELLYLYAHCRGLICTALDEDFGITPLEAMASGKPVVAVDSGGFRETVTPHTGILVKPDVMSIVTAIRQISKNPAQYHDSCIARSKEFNRETFEKKIRQWVSDNISPLSGTL